MKEDTIEHIGRVLSLDKDLVRVEIISHGACSSCRARMACGMSESAVKIVDVYTDQFLKFTIGDSVVVSVSKKNGITAVVLAYVVPLIFLMLTLVVGALLFEDSQGLVALFSLLSVAMYFAALYLFRDKLEDKIKFSITKK